VCGRLPAASTVHVPGVTSQASHEPEQARSQQVSSGEQVVPVMQPPGNDEHFWPFLALHSPALSQVPVHLVGSSAFFTGTQLRLLQVWHTPGQSLRWVHPTQVFVVRSQVAFVPLHCSFFVHWTQAPVVALQAVRDRPLQSCSAVHLTHLLALLQTGADKGQSAFRQHPPLHGGAVSLFVVGASTTAVS
jgi:hypothetical protein